MAVRGPSPSPIPLPGGERDAKNRPAALPMHGGDLAAAAARFGAPRQGWLDLSTGINPRPYPLPALPAECWSRLPGADLALRQAAARHYGAGDPEAVVAAPGSQALLQLLPHLVPTGPVAIVGPTYGELSAVWRNAGRPLVEIAEPAAAPPEAAILVLANPNNPDGRRHQPALLRDLAERLARRGGLLILDEAFADPEPALSLAAATGAPGLLILRSVGKFFGLAGLRLGFALAAPPLAAALRRALGPWPVSGPALAIGEQALGDTAWIAQTRLDLRAGARALDAALARAGLGAASGCDLFRLVATDRAPALAEHLGRGGILVREFAERPDRLRFGLPGDELPRLERALAEFT